MNSLKLFEHSLIISLDGYEERRERTQAQLESVGIKPHILRGLPLFEGEDQTRLHRQASTTFNHLRSIMTAKENGWEQVAIFEDDAEVDGSFNDRIWELKGIPDNWDAFWLTFYVHKRYYNDLNGIKVVKLKEKARVKPPIECVDRFKNPNLYRLNYGCTFTIGYIVRNRAYDKFIFELMRKGTSIKTTTITAIDHQYAATIQPNLNCYGIMPGIVYHRSGAMSIADKHVKKTNGCLTKKWWEIKGPLWESWKELEPVFKEKKT